MSVIYVLLTISIIIAVTFFVAFVISVKSGQYDDSYTPSVRMLFEDELVNSKYQKGVPSKEDKNTVKIQNLGANQNIIQLKKGKENIEKRTKTL